MTAKELVRIVPGDERVPSPGAPTGMSRPRYARAGMVEWFRPIELVRTGFSVLTSAVLESRSDRRLIEALRAGQLEYYDYSETRDGEPRRELWLDFVADTGDGFDSTYAIAHAIASDALVVNDATGARHVTERGRVLVFGGDLVYPVASRARYEQRLVMPYEQALPESGAPHPDLYAIPGNHDWYDSLVAFTRRFCSQRWFAGWRTHQRVSYFALQLPGDWWLIGVDVHLESDIDAEQVAYFKAIAAKMTERSRVILCNAEPHWIYPGQRDGVEFLDNNLRFLEERVFGTKITVFLSGDLHYYRRHSDRGGRHKIIAGGGGAFLHPTHAGDVRTLPAHGDASPYVLQHSYPDAATSRRLSWRSFCLPFSNWRLSLTLGVLYLLTCWTLPVELAGLGWGDLGTAAHRALGAVLRGPGVVLWIALMVAGMVLLAEGGSWRRRWISGALHAAVHLAIAPLAGFAAVQTVAPLAWPGAAAALAAGALIVLAGWLVGGFVIGAYLFVQLNGFGSHENNAFAPLAIPDWKSFLRLHIDPQGTLTIYPIGIDRVPRRWRSARGAPRLVPDDRRATLPRLVEDVPIQIKR